MPHVPQFIPSLGSQFPIPRFGSGISRKACHRERIVRNRARLLLVFPGKGEPRAVPLRQVYHFHQLVHHLETAHDGNQMISAL